MLTIANSNSPINKEEIQSLIDKAYQINKEFFGRDLKTSVEVFLLSSRAEMDKALGYKTQNWVVGSGSKKGIFIFTPVAFEKVAHRPQADFEEILIHECAHIFQTQLYPGKRTAWFNEGLCGYVAKQYEKRLNKELTKITWEDFNRKDWYQKPCYSNAFVFTYYLITEYGKTKLFELLNCFVENEGKDFLNTFKIIYGQEAREIFQTWQTLQTKS